jgi:DNA invertase Pin-like site-specific DNA recombinase
MITADLYLRLSDFRDDSDSFDGRERKLRAEADRLGWAVSRLVIENDLAGNGDRRRPASAFKRKAVRDAQGKITGYRVFRPGFQSVIADLRHGRVSAVLAEDLDRVARDPRDLEDLIDACAERGASARSLSGSLTLTDGGTDGEITMARVMVTMGNKSSRDTARRVAASRERLAEKGTSGKGQYGGGRRPFGYRPDPGAEKYGRTLIIVESEAAELRKAATAVLQGVSLKSLARDLREREVPTVTGAKWTPDTLRGCLLSHAVAGIAVHTATIRENGEEPREVTTEHPASWPAILGRDTWQAVRDVLTDPGRTTHTGNEPRWLVSGFGRCHCGELVYTRSSGGRPSYVCRGPSQHLRRSAAHVDAYVGMWACRILARSPELLRPPPRPGIDAGALRTEQSALTENKRRAARQHAAGELDDDDYRVERAEIKRRLDKIAATLAATTAPDPLSEFRGQPDVTAVWDKLPLARQRTIVRAILTVELLPSPRGGRGFHESSVRVQPARVQAVAISATDV